jgi:hypothetical protein
MTCQERTLLADQSRPTVRCIWLRLAEMHARHPAAFSGEYGRMVAATEASIPTSLGLVGRRVRTSHPEKFGTPLVPREVIVINVANQILRICRYFVRVSDGTRTRDRLDHNQELYQLSYAHHARREV